MSVRSYQGYAGHPQMPVSAICRWYLIAGAVVMWAGLALRIWAILVLGRAFRTTVEVDSNQAVVDRGPYRYERHPS
jgi:protein-S-isoprenylcysteine O-methyltransferase Ste14